jgi:deaminated glutathione amidase
MAEPKLSIAIAQMTSGLDPAVNLAVVEGHARAAAAGGAKLLFTPEMTNVVDGKRDRLLPKLHLEGDDPFLQRLQALAIEARLWISVGSLALLRPDGRVANRSLLIDADGDIRARYDKIHLFDVDLAGGERYRESATYARGETAVLAASPWAKLGLTICYDVRFGHLHRALAQAGADILTAPAAFTAKTGQAHWHTLLRARAIETGCFVVAAAQCGHHEDGRETFGHSLVVGPWGEVLADGGAEPGLLFADLDLLAVDRARAQVPALQHDQPFTVVEA